MKKVFLFSGQGSQYRRMGERLYKDNHVFKACMDEMDDLVKTWTGISVLDQLYDPKNRTRPFDELLQTHPAIFMVEHALDEALRSEGIFPDVVAGVSMGEFAAAVSSGVMRCEDALKALVEMAELTVRHCEPGGMLAVFADPNLYQSTQMLYANSELAGVNHNNHFVLTGDRKGLKIVEGYLRQMGILFQLLPLQFAFHSVRMDKIKTSFTHSMNRFHLETPRIPYFSSQAGGSLQTVEHSHFWRAVRDPMFLTTTFQVMEQSTPCSYIDVGPAGTLASFSDKLIDSSSASRTFRILTPFHQDSTNLQKMVTQLREENEKSMLIFVFPGQGAQKVGMGSEVFDLFPEKVAQADRILGYSIRTLCEHDPDRKLNQTEYTQPALYVINALLYEKAIREKGRKPDVVAGHSLGEYNALLAAGVFDFETGLLLVQKRGELMSQMRNGGMLAVVGLQEAEVKKVLNEQRMHTIDIANLNAPKQIVLAGPKDEMSAVQTAFEAAKAELVMPLRVSGAFHSRYMAEARKSFDTFLQTCDLRAPQITVLSNVTARPYLKDQIAKLMGEQLTSPVKWTESVQVLLGMGGDEIIEIGPSTVLRKLIDKIRVETSPILIGKPDVPIMQKVERIVPNETNNRSERYEIESQQRRMRPELLGDAAFRGDYGVKYAYVAGAMYKGIASEEMLIKLGKSGLLGFFGSGGLKLDRIEQAIQTLQRALPNGEPFGMNLVHNPADPSLEEQQVNLYLRYCIRYLEASAFMGITPALVLFRAKGLCRLENGEVFSPQKIIAKISRPEVAEAFLSPAPARLVEKLVLENKLSSEEAELIRLIPMADDICAEADSGGHTDHAVALALLPSIILQRDRMMRENGIAKRVRVGAAGGIGTPGAAASMFLMGADFIMTGSINQCTVEAGTSPLVKDLLSQMNVQDTESAPAGDMFEIGARVQVLKKGLFFPARANKLYELYRQFNSLDELDAKTRQQLQDRYFKRSFDEIYEEVKAYQPQEEIAKAECNPKHKMALIFKWYFGYSTRIAMQGDAANKVDFQVHCGPALGAFNQWVAGTKLESWQYRHVDEIGIQLMEDTATLLSERLAVLFAV